LKSFLLVIKKVVQYLNLPYVIYIE
jgi:hypothetical protein